MSGISHTEAVERARGRTALDATVPARVFPVRRLDRPEESYLLVLFGDPTATVAVAAVSPVDGEPLSWANLPGTAAHLRLGETAAERAGLSGGVAELVWQPCRATRSLLYPLWEVRTPTRTAYVDQSGNVWDALTPGGPGG